MARVRIDETTVPGGAYAGDEAMYLFTVVLSLLVGLILLILAWRGRQIWLLSGATGLILASLAYLTWVAVR